MAEWGGVDGEWGGIYGKWSGVLGMHFSSLFGSSKRVRLENADEWFARIVCTTPSCLHYLQEWPLEIRGAVILYLLHNDYATDCKNIDGLVKLCECLIREQFICCLVII